MNLVDRTYPFHCDNLNFKKSDVLYKKARNLREFKNEISLTVHENPYTFMNMSKYEWVNYFRKQIQYCNNQDVSHAIGDVYVAYDNKRKKYKEKTNIKVQNGIHFKYYKKNGKNFRKGQVKEMETKWGSTDLSKVITYLTKYYHDGLIHFLKKEKSDNEDIQQFRDKVLYYIDKFGERLISLIRDKQNRITDEAFKHPIEFSSLTFRSCTEQKENVIVKNKRTTSKYNAFISLPGQSINGGKIYIPTKYSPKFHGSLQHFHKEPNGKNIRTTTYTVIFEGNRIKVNLTRKKRDETITDKSNYKGIDVNVKHNLFCGEDGGTIDYDRKMLNDYISFLKEMDKKLSRKEEKTLSKKDSAKKKRWNIRFQNMLKEKCSELVRKTKNEGKDHLVLENLEQFGKGFTRSEELMGFKYSRLTRLLHLGELKHIIKSIGNKNGIQITFVPSEYTSQGCDRCGLVDKRNRKEQENFKCIGCGYAANADAHSAKMVADRMNEDVLRSKLMKQNKAGEFVPRKLKRSTIKNILMECYDINMNGNIHDKMNI